MTIAEHAPSDLQLKTLLLEPSHVEAPEFDTAGLVSFKTDTGSVTICPDGPILVRGDMQIVGADGVEIPRTHQVVALCRCGKSGLAPLCDGTHKVGCHPAGKAQRTP